MSNTVTFDKVPGKIIIDSILHQTESAVNDITKLMIEFNVHSSVMVGASYAELTINDYVNYVANGDINPGDTFTINIQFHDEIVKYIYKLGKIEDIKNFENGRTYNLKLISELEYYSIYRKISQSFIGQTSEIAKKIFSDHTTEKFNIWEPSLGNETVCIPTWSPIKTISWLAKRSRGLHSSSRFVFFQDSRQKYNFMSLEKLKELYVRPVATYTYHNNNLGTDGSIGINPNSERSLFTIYDLDYLNTMDIAKAYENGTMRNTKIRTDLTTKSIDIVQNSYWDTYSRRSLTTGAQWKYEESEPGRVVFENTAYQSTYTGGFNKVSDETVANPEFDRSQQLEIVVIGNKSIDVGMIINVEIPSPEPESSVKKFMLDPLWSGKYFVLSKRDVMDMTGHKMALRLGRGLNFFKGNS